MISVADAGWLAVACFTALQCAAVVVLPIAWARWRGR